MKQSPAFPIGSRIGPPGMVVTGMTPDGKVLCEHEDSENGKRALAEAATRADADRPVTQDGVVVR